MEDFKETVKGLFSIVICILLLRGCFAGCEDQSDSRELVLADPYTQQISQMTEVEANALPVTDPAFVKWYADKYGIEIYGWDEYVRLLRQAENIIAVSDENSMVFLKQDGKPFQEKYLVRTSDTSSDYVYIGDMRDNKPHGFGLLCKPNGDRYYMGHFEDGYYAGFGVLYNMPGELEEYMLVEAFGSEALTTMRDVMNYCTYMGEFQKNNYNGRGTEFSYLGIYQNPEVKRSIDYLTGDFTDGEIDGRFTYHVDSYLYAEGKYEKKFLGFEGDVTVYYPSSEQIKYKGGIKGEVYDGYGTKYDENGNVIYAGEWDFGDYAAD